MIRIKIYLGIKKNKIHTFDMVKKNHGFDIDV